MDDKVSDEPASRQSVNGAPRTLESQRHDALFRLQQIQEWKDRMVQRLQDPQCPVDEFKRRAGLINAVYLAACVGGEIEPLARTYFFTMFHYESTLLRERGTQEVSLDATAESILHRLGLGFALHFGKMWEQKESTDTLSLTKNYLAAWLEKSEWTEAGGAPALELLRRARLNHGDLTLGTLRTLWLRWLEQPENNQGLPSYESRKAGRPRRRRREHPPE